MVAIVDYGMGNLGSVRNILKKIGVDSVITSSPSAIARADSIILPGVGAFATGIANLRKRDLVSVLEDRVHSGVPILGCCLGLQLMTQGSEEGGECGLGWIAAQTVAFSRDDRGMSLRIPHMGWNQARVVSDHPLFEGVEADARYYFVHSYHLASEKPSEVAMITDYGYEFASGVAVANVMGVQFHPEKSHKFGMRLLRNFANLKPAA